MRARLATPADASSIAGIYNQAIEDRTATFETDLRTDDDIIAWFDNAHPVVVVLDDVVGVSGSGAVREEVVAFARTSAYRPRECYSGVFEFGVYTDHNHRRHGAATLAMRELITHAREFGAWKLLSRVFVENAGSRALLADLGFREVGVYQRHAKLDGEWRDVVIVEKFLAPLVVEAGVKAGAGGPGRAPQGRASRDQILTSLRSETLQTRVHALEHARAMLEAHQFPDPDLLAAATDALFLVKVHDTTARSRFVDLFRMYASLSVDAARDLYDALFERIGRLSISHDLDAFYEATFVVKQVASASVASHAHAHTHANGTQPPDLAVHVPRLIEWMKLAIELPQVMRGSRISPGNVTSLLMNLALAGCESEEQKQHVADLAAEAKARHRVEPPVSIRSSVPPPPMIDLPVFPTVPPPSGIGAETIEVAAVAAPVSSEAAEGPEVAEAPKPPPLPPAISETPPAVRETPSEAPTVEVAAIALAAIEADALAAPPASQKKKRGRRAKAELAPGEAPPPKKKRAPRSKKSKPAEN